ncbi:MAG: hypothetical protein WC359_13020 [Dehalococcoidia bacterium]|jgi:hypothetical protein
MPDIVDQIMGAAIPKQLKLIRLYAVTQLKYRQPLGDKAWDAINEMTDSETTAAIAFIGGMMSGIPNRKTLEKLIAFPM